MENKIEVAVVPREELMEMIETCVRRALGECGQPRNPNDSPEYYTVEQLKEMWGVSDTTIWRHEKMGHLKGIRIGRRVLYPKKKVDAIKVLMPTNRDVKVK